jgi:hypothetical protein
MTVTKKERCQSISPTGNRCIKKARHSSPADHKRSLHHFYHWSDFNKIDEWWPMTDVETDVETGDKMVPDSGPKVTVVVHWHDDIGQFVASAEYHGRSFSCAHDYMIDALEGLTLQLRDSAVDTQSTEDGENDQPS